MQLNKQLFYVKFLQAVDIWVSNHNIQLLKDNLDGYFSYLIATGFLGSQ